MIHSVRVRARVVPALMLGTAAMVLAGCTSAPAPGSSDGAVVSPPMVVAITPVSTAVCVQVTQERGAFKDAGLDVEVKPAAPTSAAQIASVLNGQVTVGLGGYTGAISAVATGLPVVITNAADYGYDYGEGKSSSAVIVAEGSPIASLKDLEGKTVAVNSLQGTWELGLRQAIEEDGGDPSKVQLTAISFGDQIAALKSSRVDAIFTLQPILSSLIGQGFRSLGDPFAVTLGHSDYATAVMFMSKDFVTSHPDAAKTFVDTLSEGDAWCNDHPDDMIEAITRITGIPAVAVAAAPLPVWGAGIDSDETATWVKLLKDFKVIDTVPTVDTIQWSGAPVR